MRLNNFVWIILFFWTFVIHGQGLLKETLLDSIPVFFEPGSFGVKKPNLILARVNEVEKQTFGRIVLMGYTDSVGSLEFNQVLASKRLQSVKKIIEGSKFKGYLLDSLNRNELRGKEPVDDSQYRRVDILIYKMEPNYVMAKPINLNIQFVVASDYVEKGSMESLKQLLYVMKSDDSLKIVLNGHVCCAPDQPMSLKRAKRVKTYLVNNGIDEKRITCFGYSNSVKLVEEVSSETRAINRRVEVVFLKN